MYEVKPETKENILEEFRKELERREYCFGEYNLKTIIDECFKQKQNLLELLSKHPLWNPDKLMIQFDRDFERRIELNEVNRFYYWLSRELTTYGKSLDELQCTDEENIRRKNILNWISDNVQEQFFNDSMKEAIDKVNSYNENFKLRTNMKASKAIGKICREEGWDKLEGYNQRYAALCDNLNPIKVKRHTVISLNPIDFLLMSNGDSWDSCHYIGDYSDDAGCYSSGTISYMLDECSFVFYTVSADFDGTDIELQPKSQREIFGYNDEVFVQSRLYPQANDSGADAIYNDIRNIVQKIIADCLDKPNLWIVSRNLDKVNEIVEKGNDATCYPDWRKGNPGSSHCCVSTLKGRTDRFKKITLGAKPICIECGCRHSYTENISCCTQETCTKCGCHISDDETYWVDDDPYCYDCVLYCCKCGEYEVYDKAIEVGDESFCEYCAERYLIQCDECGEYCYKDDMYYLKNGKAFCEYCYDENAFCCPECGNYYECNEGEYDRETNTWYCNDCYEDLLEEREEDEYEQEA